mmetsp:Transcript_39418/g.101034  ORF Transcript_39418/g.101034 Transcript_39418/m.101034 type:complete len:387 (-) Transcript_39418:148-1308(-)
MAGLAQSRWTRQAPIFMPACARLFSRVLPSLSPIALQFAREGDPRDVMQLAESRSRELSRGEVRVRVLMSPINPADINTVQGTYGTRPPRLPAVGGYEFVGEVVETMGTADLREGDRVIPFLNSQRTFVGGGWSSEVVESEGSFLRVPPSLELTAASTLFINGFTAVLLLRRVREVAMARGGIAHDAFAFVQNAANSNLGRYILKLARLERLRSINFVRPSSTDEERVRELEAESGGLGTVLKYGESLSPSLPDSALPFVGLNSIGGSYARDVTACLRDSGVLITFGGMSGRPLMMPASDLIFRDISFEGFWLSKRLSLMERCEAEEVVAHLADADARLKQQGSGLGFADNVVHTISARSSPADVRSIFEQAMSGKGGKHLLAFDT